MKSSHFSGNSVSQIVVILATFVLLSVSHAGTPYQLIAKFDEGVITWPLGEEDQCFSLSQLTIEKSIESILENNKASLLCKSDPTISLGYNSYINIYGNRVYVPYLYNRFIIDFPSEIDRDNAMSALGQNNLTRYALLEVEPEPCSMSTSDAWFFDSWHWKSIYDYDIDADEAWQLIIDQSPGGIWNSDIILGDNESVIAGHPDMDYDRLELVGDGSPHGTFVISLIGGAIPDNDIGVTGLHWAADIYGHRTMTPSDLVNVENMKSFSWPFRSSLGFASGNREDIEDAAYTTMHNVVWVASTGNFRVSGTRDWWSRNRGVFGATSFNVAGNDGGWTTIDANADIAIPGEDLWGCERTNNPTLAHRANGYYNENRGTSWSAPIGTGAIGILHDQAALRTSPVPLTGEDAMHILETTSEDRQTPGYDDYSGWGNMNIWYATHATKMNPIRHNTITSSQITPVRTLEEHDVVVEFEDVPWTGAGMLSGDYRVDIYKVKYSVPFSPSAGGTPVAWGSAIDTWGLDIYEEAIYDGNILFVPCRMATYLEEGTLTQSGGEFFTFQYNILDNNGNPTNDYAPDYWQDMRVYYTLMDFVVPLPPQIIVSESTGDRAITITPNRVTGDDDVSYKIDRSTDGVNWTTVETGHSNTTYQDTDQMTGVRSWWYRVSAYNHLGQYSLPSREVGISVDPFETTPDATTYGNTRQICEDKSLTQHIVYEDGGYIYYSLLPKVNGGQGFIPEIEVSGPNSKWPTVAVWDSVTPSKAFVAWHNAGTGLQVREIERFNRGSVINLPNVPTGLVSPPTLVAAGNDVPTLFAGISGAGSGLYYWTRNTNGTWSNPSIVPGTAADDIYSVACFSNDEIENVVHLVWSNDDGNGAVYYDRATWSGTAWSWTGTPTRLDNGLLNSANYPSVVADLDGYAHVAWEVFDTNGGDWKIHTRKNSAAGWESEQELIWASNSDTRKPVLGFTRNRGCSSCLTPVDTTIISVEWTPSTSTDSYLRFYYYDNENEVWQRSLQGETDPVKSHSISPYSMQHWDKDSTWPVSYRNNCLYYSGLRGDSAPYDVLKNPYRSNTITVPHEYDVTSDCAINAKFHMDLDVHVSDGATLTINTGTANENQVIADEELAIYVTSGSFLSIDGTQVYPIVFRVLEGASHWGGVFIDGGSADIEYASFENGQFVAEDPSGSATPISIRNSTFTGLGIRLFGSPGLTQKVENCEISDITAWNGLHLYNCYVDFDSVIVRDCDVINSYIKKVSGSFRNCVFKGHVSNYAVLCNTPTCNPSFMCCEFTDLAPFSGSFMTSVFSATGCSPTFGGQGYQFGVSNVFNDSSAYLLVIQGTGALATINSTSLTLPALGGQNDFYQRDNSGGFIQWRNYPGTPPANPYSAESQYWNPSPPVIGMFNPSNASYWDYTPYQANPYDVCGGASGGGETSVDPGRLANRSGAMDDFDPESELAYAIYLESEEEFTQAQSAYYSVATYTEDPTMRWQAMSGLITTQVHIGQDGSWIVSLLDSLMEADEYSYESNLHGYRLLTSYYLNVEDYDDAIDVCTDLLNSGLLFHDSVLVASDLIGVQMAAGIIDWTGGLDSDTDNRIPNGLKISSVPEGIERENDLLQLLGLDGPPPASKPVPTKYELYQNYPNPFNPSTQIRYDLPEAVRVKINVYNTLGQFVVQLTDNVQAAGSYNILWDGKNAAGVDVSAGMYIYQLKAGPYSKAKKMLLLR